MLQSNEAWSLVNMDGSWWEFVEIKIRFIRITIGFTVLCALDESSTVDLLLFKFNCSLSGSPNEVNFNLEDCKNFNLEVKCFQVYI